MTSCIIYSKLNPGWLSRMSLDAIWQRKMSPENEYKEGKKRQRGWDPTSEEQRQSPRAWNGEAYLVLGLCHDPRSTVAGSNPH